MPSAAAATAAPDAAAVRCSGRVPGKHPTEVSLAEDQDTVGDLGSDSQDKAFGEAVRTRTPGRDLDHFYARVGKRRVERCRELSGSIADEEPEPVGCQKAGLGR